MAGSHKLHVIDMYQITDAFDKYKSSMEKVGKAIQTNVANTGLDVLYYLELAIFCFITGNNDMHLKNFSLLLENDEWRLAPAYDLLNVSIANPEDEEEFALTIDAKKKKLKKENFMRLGTGLGLTERQMNGIFSRIIKNREKAIEWINRSFLSAEYKKAYLAILNDRYKRFEKSEGNGKSGG